MPVIGSADFIKPVLTISKCIDIVEGIIERNLGCWSDTQQRLSRFVVLFGLKVEEQQEQKIINHLIYNYSGENEHLTN